MPPLPSCPLLCPSHQSPGLPDAARVTEHQHLSPSSALPSLTWMGAAAPPVLCPDLTSPRPLQHQVRSTNPVMSLPRLQPPGFEIWPARPCQAVCAVLLPKLHSHSSCGHTGPGKAQRVPVPSGPCSFLPWRLCPCGSMSPGPLPLCQAGRLASSLENSF